MPSHCGLGEAAQRESCFAKCISSLRSSPGGNGGLVAQAYRCVRPRPPAPHSGRIYVDADSCHHVSQARVFQVLYRSLRVRISSTVVYGCEHRQGSRYNWYGSLISLASPLTHRRESRGEPTQQIKRNTIELKGPASVGMPNLGSQKAPVIHGIWSLST